MAERALSHVAVSYTHLRAHETVLDLVCRLLLEKKNAPIPIMRPDYTHRKTIYKFVTTKETQGGI